MTLTLTVRGNKKLCFHLESAWVSAHTQGTLQWSEKLQDTTPSNFTITGPGCCRLLKQLPQGDQSNLVYTSLSSHSSNLAQVITTSLSSPKSSPKVLSQKATFCSARHLDSDRNKHSISMPRHFLDGLMFVLQVSVTQRSLLTQNTSVTLTHICRTGPTHSITAHGWSLSLNVPPRLERTNKSSDLPLICSLPSARAAVKSHIKDKPSAGGLSISTASCIHHSAMGTGQRDTLQLEMETWGLCPWHVPAAPQKKCEHTFLRGKRTLFLPVISPASGLLLFIHLMKLNHFTSRCFFSCAWCCLPVRVCSVRAWMTGQAYMYVCIWQKCVPLALCENAFLGWEVFGMHLSLEASINRNPSLSIVQQLFSNWFEGLDQLHALRICMLHEHNLLTPIGNSVHPFALFLHPYTKLTNLRP